MYIDFEGPIELSGYTELSLAKKLGYTCGDVDEFLRRNCPEGYWFGYSLGKKGIWPMVGYCNRCGNHIDHPKSAYRIHMGFDVVVCPHCKTGPLRWEK